MPQEDKGWYTYPHRVPAQTFVIVFFFRGPEDGVAIADNWVQKAKESAAFAGAKPECYIQKGKLRRMLRRIPLPTFYDVYQTVIAIIGMVAICRVLFEYSWARSIGYGVGTVLAYWAGTGLVTLFQKDRDTKGPDISLD